MAGLSRSAKSGSDWTSNDLTAYNIIVHRQSAEESFECQPDTIPKTIDPDFPTATVPPNANDNLSDTTYWLLQYIHLATNANFGQESAIHDVAREQLRLLGFEERGTLLRSRFPIPFMVSGDDGRVTGLCLMQGSSTILLVLHQDKTAIGSKNPEAQVITQGIAAFQHNNAIRDRAGLDRLETMIIPAITMIGTRPSSTTFLSLGPSAMPLPWLSTLPHRQQCSSIHYRLSEGIEVPEFTQDILRYYEAFRKVAKGC